MTIMLNKQEMDDWDAAIRSILLARKKEKNLSDGDLGEKAFEKVAASVKSKVQYVLVGQGSGEKRKPQQLRAADLMNLCEALDLSITDVMEAARRLVKERDDTMFRKLGGKSETSEV